MKPHVDYFVGRIFAVDFRVNSNTQVDLQNASGVFSAEKLSHFERVLFTFRNTGRSPLRSGPSPHSLGAFVAGFKAAATKRINEIRHSLGAPVWQRNYYEHIIRGDGELLRVREYILNNPAAWKYDRENPSRPVDAKSSRIMEPWCV